jgi:hypothetical protein
MSTSTTLRAACAAGCLLSPLPALAAMDCSALAGLDFPIKTTRITLADATNPAYCRVQGIAEERTGVDGVAYAIRFEVRLPLQWNGRFLFQGTGGTQGSVPGASGTGVGTVANGFAVASDDGGHDNTKLPLQAGLSRGNLFYGDPQAVRDWTYNSTSVTTRIAKHLIASFYGRPAAHSYFVGCSTGGHDGMGQSQRFPEHFDGIVAGAPFFMPPMISLSETWTVQQVASVSPKDAAGNPIYWQSYSDSDRELFTSGILEACDALDGLADGVIDNPKACRFDPRKLQCTGAKDASCLSKEQVTAIRNMARGPRTSWGLPVTALGGRPVSGYPYDGGWMEPSGIPARNIGTERSAPGNLELGMQQLPLFWFRTPEPLFWLTRPDGTAGTAARPENFDWDRDMALVVRREPDINDNLDLRAYRKRGGKLMFWHGLSDSGPPWTYTAAYYELARLFNGGDFMRLYLVPNMGHCGGGPSTDRFDMLTPVMDWVEKGIAPDSVAASGTSFKTAPTTRSRPLCAYPKTARYTGPEGGDIALAENYSCVSERHHPHRDDDDD